MTRKSVENGNYPHLQETSLWQHPYATLATCIFDLDVWLHEPRAPTPFIPDIILGKEKGKGGPKYEIGTRWQQLPAVSSYRIE